MIDVERDWYYHTHRRGIEAMHKKTDRVRRRRFRQPRRDLGSLPPHRRVEGSRGREAPGDRASVPRFVAGASGARDGEHPAAAGRGRNRPPPPRSAMSRSRPSPPPGDSVAGAHGARARRPVRQQNGKPSCAASWWASPSMIFAAGDRIGRGLGRKEVRCAHLARRSHLGRVSRPGMGLAGQVFASRGRSRRRRPAGRRRAAHVVRGRGPLADRVGFVDDGCRGPRTPPPRCSTRCDRSRAAAALVEQAGHAGCRGAPERVGGPAVRRRCGPTCRGSAQSPSYWSELAQPRPEGAEAGRRSTSRLVVRPPPAPPRDPASANQDKPSGGRGAPVRPLPPDWRHPRPR